jgi:MFS family permease
MPEVISGRQPLAVESNERRPARDPHTRETPTRVSLIPIFLIVLVDVFGMTLVLPLLAIYAETFHATPLQATLLVSIFALCQFASGPIIGHWSDRIGRRPLLLFSQIGTCLGFVIMASASALWMIYLSRIIDGATAGNLSLAQAYIADHTSPEERTKALGLIGMAFGIGLFIGPAVTGLLSARYGLTAPIWMAALLSATSLVCTLLLLKDSPPTTGRAPRKALLNWRTYAEYFRQPELGLRLLQFLFYALAFSTFLSGFALFAERRYVWNGRPFGPREIGLVFAYLGLLGIILQSGLLGRLAARYGDRALVSAGLSALVFGFFVLGFSHSMIGLVLAITPLALANGVLRPALGSLITQQVRGPEQGLLAGLMASLVSLASMVAPMGGGVLIDAHRLAAWAWTAGGLGFVSIAVAWLPAHRAAATRPSTP